MGLSYQQGQEGVGWREQDGNEETIKSWVGMWAMTGERNDGPRHERVTGSRVGMQGQETRDKVELWGQGQHGQGQERIVGDR